MINSRSMIGALRTIPDHTKDSFQYHGSLLREPQTTRPSSISTATLPTTLLLPYLFIAFLTRATQDFDNCGKLDANSILVNLRQLSFQSLTPYCLRHSATLLQHIENPLGPLQPSYSGERYVPSPSNPKALQHSRSSCHIHHHQV